MILTILYNFVLQVVLTLGVIIAFGFAISLCNRSFYKNMGAFGTIACYVTGFIGTPVHECAHALMCIVFRHKITDMKLFQINSADGTLGYVCHSYNKKSLYQRIGNFFIGIAPILVISALLYLLSQILIPEMVELISVQINTIQLQNNLFESFEYLGNIVVIFFSFCSTGKWWIFTILGSFLALHMTLSTADIKNAKSGLLLLLGAILVADVILALLSVDLLYLLTSSFLEISGYLSSFLSLALIVSIFAVLASYCCKKLLRK